jgi:hypothetical protein
MSGQDAETIRQPLTRLLEELHDAIPKQEYQHMAYDQTILEEFLAEYPPDYAYLIRHFFATYERIDGAWVRKTASTPENSCTATPVGSREAGLPTLEAEAARRSPQPEPEGLTAKEVRS